MSLVAHYRLDGDAADAIGPHNGTAHNVTWVEGKLGACGSFDAASGSYIDLGDSPDFNFRAEVTLSCWVKLSASTSWMRLIMRGPHTNYQMDISTTKSLRMEAWNSDGVRFRVHSTTLLQDDIWYHCLVSIGGGKQRLYLNGVLEDEITWTGSIVSQPGASLRIGSDPDGELNLQGLIDDVRIYDHALSIKEVDNLSKALVLHLKMNGLTDSSGQRCPVISTDAEFSQSSAVGDRCYFNPGGVKYLTVQNAPHVTKDQTIAMWLYPTNFEVRRNPWNRAYGGEGSITQETDGRLSYYWGTDGGNDGPYQQVQTSSQTPLPLNEWTHVALVRDLSSATPTLTWYVNGEENFSKSSDYSEAALSVANVAIGDGYCSPYYGGIDDVREYASALSGEDIKKIYKQRFSLDDEGNMHTHGITSLDDDSDETNPVFATKTNISENGILKSPDFSECAVTDGLAAWFPLKGETIDLAERNDAVNYGAVPTERGYSFTGDSGIFIRGSLPLDPISWTISLWVMKRAHTVDSYPIFVSFNLPYISCGGEGFPFRLSYMEAAQTHTQGSTIPELNTWYHVAATSGPDGTKLYVNGELEGENTDICTNTGGTFEIGRHRGLDAYRVDGKASDLRIFNKVLISKQIKILYLMTDPQSKDLMKITNNYIYTKGQLGEVIV